MSSRIRQHRGGCLLHHSIVGKLSRHSTSIRPHSPLLHASLLGDIKNTLSNGIHAWHWPTTHAAVIDFPLDTPPQHRRRLYVGSTRPWLSLSGRQWPFFCGFCILVTPRGSISLNGLYKEIMRVFIVLSTDGSLIGCFSCGVDVAECGKRTGGHVHVCALNEELSAGFVSPDANQVSTWGSECEGWEKY